MTSPQPNQAFAATPALPARPSSSKATRPFKCRPRFPPLILLPDGSNPLKYLLAQRDTPAPAPPSELPPGPRTPSFVFGVVADVQYAQLPTYRGVRRVSVDGRTVHVRRRTAWREALGKLRAAVHAFNKADVDFVLNLGDAVEGYGPGRRADSLRDFRAVMSAFSAARAEVRHVIGNHCRCIPERLLCRAMRLAVPYYAFEPAPGWRAVVLHTTELCGSAEEMGEEGRLELDAIVEREGRERHHYHGAVGRVQLEWLAQQLDDAQRAGERVMVFSHYPLADGAARSSHVLANTSEVRAVIERAGSPVAICLAGHDHAGGALSVPLTGSPSSVTYVTIPAILEAPADGNAYALVTAFSDGSVQLEGVGSVPSRAIPTTA